VASPLWPWAWAVLVIAAALTEAACSPSSPPAHRRPPPRGGVAGPGLLVARPRRDPAWVALVDANAYPPAPDGLGARAVVSPATTPSSPSTTVAVRDGAEDEDEDEDKDEDEDEDEDEDIFSFLMHNHKGLGSMGP